MKIFLKGTPSWMARWASKSSEGSWIYFGSDFQYANQLESALGVGFARIRFEELLYQTSNNHRLGFIQWIDAVSELNKDSEEWYYSAPANKNPYVSKLFISICYFLVLKTLIERGQNINAVFVDSPALADLIRQRFAPNSRSFLNDVLKLCWHSWWFIKSVIKYFLFILKSIKELVLARYVLKGRVADVLKDKKNLLIRAYISDDFVDDGNNMLERHYFPGLYRYYESKGMYPVFLGFVLNTKRLGHLFRTILKSKTKIFFPCEIFRWQDYLYAFGAPLRRLFKNPVARMADVTDDLSGLLLEDAMIHKADDETLTAFLFSCFGTAYRARGFDVERLVNWCEFQNFEKGLMRGMHAAFPDVQIIGAQPFLKPANHLSLFPSKQDVIFKAMPDKLLLLGKLDTTLVKNILPKARLDFSPAFRYQSVFRSPDLSSGNNVFVLLGYGLASALHILKVLLEVQRNLKGFGRVFIKLHPAGYFDEQRIRRIFKNEWPDHFQFVYGQLDDYLSSTAIGICGATGTSVELAVRGIPVILIAETYGLTMDYLQVSDNYLWRLCFNQQEVLKAIEDFSVLKKDQADLLEKRAAVFKAEHFVEQESHLWENYL